MTAGASGGGPASVGVVGAGVVGMTAALALQRDGHRVTVFDPHPPGRGASFGNAGVLAVELIDPLSTPDVLRQAPRLWLDPNGPVGLPPGYWHRSLPWVARFVSAARPATVARSRTALAALNGAALAAWRRLLASIDAADELVHSGYCLVWESSRGLEAAKRRRDHLGDWGIESRLLTGEALLDREPGLTSRLSHGLFFPAGHHVRDPARLVERLADAFRSRGGRIRRVAVDAIDADTGGVRIRSGADAERLDRAVLAAGAWSRSLLAGLGVSVPLEAERGYHLSVPGATSVLRRVIGSAERRIVMTPLEGGLRVVGMTEWGGLNRPPDPRRFRVLGRHAGALLAHPAVLEGPTTSWMGHRPTLPDALPVIGPVPGQPRVCCAFGHQHLGLTQAAVTAELVADQVSGRTSTLAVSPYRVERFRRE